MRKTKIICTLGPSSNTKDIIKQMALAGMNVARLNMSHGTHESHRSLISLVKQVRNELHLPIAIMIDTKGPEIRICQFENAFIKLEAGETFTLTTDTVLGNQKRVGVTLKSFNKLVKVGSIVLINDGLVKLQVEQIKSKNVICRVLVGGVLSNNKSINIPGVSLDKEYLSDVDKQDLLFGIEQDADIFAISFVGIFFDIGRPCGQV